MAFGRDLFKNIVRAEAAAAIEVALAVGEEIRDRDRIGFFADIDIHMN